jgi:hypothetical protein
VATPLVFLNVNRPLSAFRKDRVGSDVPCHTLIATVRKLTYSRWRLESRIGLNAAIPGLLVLRYGAPKPPLDIDKGISWRLEKEALWNDVERKRST